MALDLPTQCGYDSDDPMAEAEVGRVGVAIDTLRDMEILFDGLPLGEVSTSFTINGTAAIILAMCLAVAERRGVPWERVARKRARPWRAGAGLCLGGPRLSVFIESTSRDLSEGHQPLPEDGAFGAWEPVLDWDGRAGLRQSQGQAGDGDAVGHEEPPPRPRG